MIPGVRQGFRRDPPRRADDLQQIVLRVAARPPRPARPRRTAPRTRAGYSRPSGTSRCACARRPPGSRCGCWRMSNGTLMTPMPSSSACSFLAPSTKVEKMRRRHAAVQPGHRLALRVDARFQVLHRHRVEVGVHQVVLARPRQLDRLALHRLGDDGRLDGEVGLGLPPEPAAEQRDVHGHVGRRQAQPLRHQILRGLGRLEAPPHLGLAPGDAHGRGRRLHGRVGQVGDVVLGLDLLRGGRHARRRRCRCRARPCRACARTPPSRP